MLSFLFAVGHTAGGQKNWSPIAENEVLHAMRSFQFHAAGVSRTYLDFYLGFGFVLSVYLFLQAVVLWQLASLAKEQPGRVRPMIASFFIASAVATGLTWAYIFPIPTVFSAVITISLGWTYYLAGRDAASQSLVKRSGERMRV